MDAPFSLTPSFITGVKGKLFALHCAPRKTHPNTECFLVVPSFAEDMNRCRYMTNMLSQALASHGHAVLTVDPYGTGDSAGEFVDADWGQWVADIVTAGDYARELGYERISLLGIRLGAPLACAVAAGIGPLHRILFWQPVISGKASLHQFLRLKIAASMGRDEQAGTIAQFEEVLEQGNNIQVAGYDISPQLYQGIKTAHLSERPAETTCPVGWFTVLASAERKTPRPDLAVISEWRTQGVEIDHQVVVGPAFWQAHERTLAPNLVSSTVDYIISEPRTS